MPEEKEVQNVAPDTNDIRFEDQIRLEQFLREYAELRDKTQYDFGGAPLFVMNQEKNTFDVSITIQPVDISGQPIKSPFIPQS